MPNTRIHIQYVRLKIAAVSQIAAIGDKKVNDKSGEHCREEDGVHSTLRGAVQLVHHGEGVLLAGEAEDGDRQTAQRIQIHHEETPIAHAVHLGGEVRARIQRRAVEGIQEDQTHQRKNPVHPISILKIKHNNRIR